MNLKRLLDWRLHVLVAIVSLVAEAIGILKFPIGVGALLLLPLFYSFIICTLLNPHLFSATSKVLPKHVSEAASPIILLAIMPFIALFGSNIGPAIEQLISAGPALILQELGNLGTMVLAVPVAVLLLKMGRETIGATHSIAREPNIAIISDKYGLKGPEGIGVMGVYVVGTMFGTLWFALMAGYLGSLGIFDPRALAMACGAGSGSMMAACSAALAAVLPEKANEILAFAGASNLLTYATGLYVSLFVALPLTEKFYRVLRGQPAPASVGAQAVGNQTADEEALADDSQKEGRPERELGKTAVVVAVVTVVLWITNTINGAPLMEALPGMIILYVMTMLGFVVTRYSPFYLPAVAWVSLVSVALTLPWTPGSDWIVQQLSSVNVLAIVTPVLAYAGLALTRREFNMFRKAGWKLIIISLLVFTGTYLGSATVAQLLL